MKNNKSYKVLSGMEPFNEIWYQDCFYSALFPIIKYYGGKVYTFLSNSLGVYKYGEMTDFKLKYEMLYNKKISELLLQNDIDIGSKKVSGRSIVSQIENSLNQEKAVIIPIDCFYEPFRDDTYGKLHWLHYIPIYGYDRTKELFYIIEHKYSSSLLFEKRELTYADTVHCYEGFLNNSPNQNKTYTYYDFNKASNHNQGNISYIRLIKEKQNEILIGIRGLELFVSDFASWIANENMQPDNLNDIVKTCSNIVNNKKVERYCALKEVNDSSVNTMEEIIFYWNFIRGIIKKYQYSKKYNEISFQKCVEKLYTIIELEQKYYSDIMGA